MLHRIYKKNDINKDKYIGVGGHLEKDESPDECLVREIFEETGCHVEKFSCRGTVTFVSGRGLTEYMWLYTANGFKGELKACDEGELKWVKKDEVWDLELWPGDRIFFRLLAQNSPYFSLKLVYDSSDNFKSAFLNGRELELFDIYDENGNSLNRVEERGVVHTIGLYHKTVHIWIVRKIDDRYEVLLQKRSQNKDSHPGSYDISSAGHITAGDEPLPSAIRELKEELGILAFPEDLTFIGSLTGGFDAVFNNRPFKDKEISMIYLYNRSVNENELVLQPDEVDSVKWFSLDDCLNDMEGFRNCLRKEELLLLKRMLKIQ